MNDFLVTIMPIKPLKGFIDFTYRKELRPLEVSDLTKSRWRVAKNILDR